MDRRQIASLKFTFPSAFLDTCVISNQCKARMIWWNPSSGAVVFYQWKGDSYLFLKRWDFLLPFFKSIQNINKRDETKIRIPRRGRARLLNPEILLRSMQVLWSSSIKVLTSSILYVLFCCFYSILRNYKGAVSKCITEYYCDCMKTKQQPVLCER